MPTGSYNYGPDLGGWGGSSPTGGGSPTSGGFDWSKLIPWIQMGLNTGGSMLQASASNKVTSTPAKLPQALFPWLQSQYASMVGGPTGIGATAGGTLQEMMKTGMPTDVGPAWEALFGAKQRMTRQGRENIAEMFGASGQRFGTPLMNSLVDYESQVSADFMQILSEYTRQAQEAAKQRMLSSSQYGFEAFGAPALATAPSEYITTGGQSILGAGMSSLGSGLAIQMLLKKLAQG